MLIQEQANAERLEVVGSDFIPSLVEGTGQVLGENRIASIVLEHCPTDPDKASPNAVRSFVRAAVYRAYNQELEENFSWVMSQYPELEKALDRLDRGYGDRRSDRAVIDEFFGTDLHGAVRGQYRSYVREQERLARQKYNLKIDGIIEHLPGFLAERGDIRLRLERRLRERPRDEFVPFLESELGPRWQDVFKRYKEIRTTPGTAQQSMQRELVTSYAERLRAGVPLSELPLLETDRILLERILEINAMLQKERLSDWGTVKALNEFNDIWTHLTSKWGDSTELINSLGFAYQERFPMRLLELRQTMTWGTDPEQVDRAIRQFRDNWNTIKDVVPTPTSHSEVMIKPALDNYADCYKERYPTRKTPDQPPNAVARAWKRLLRSVQGLVNFD